MLQLMVHVKGEIGVRAEPYAATFRAVRIPQVREPGIHSRARVHLL